MTQSGLMTDVLQIQEQKTGRRGGGGGDRYILEVLVNLPELGFRRGDYVEAKARAGIQFGRLMMAEIDGRVHFGRFFPHSCSTMRFERAGGETRMIPSETEIGQSGILVLSTRMTASEGKKKWDLPEVPQRRKGAK